MTTVQRWSGAEARALRTALRFSVRGFATHLGVAPRTVSKWESGGSSTIPLPDTQAMLDTVLARADTDAQQRFTSMCNGRAVGDAADSPRSRTVEDTDDVKRRELLQLLSASAATFVSPVSWETEPSHRTSEPLSPDLWGIYSTARSKETVLPAVQDQIDVVTDALAGATSAVRRRGLCGSISEVYQLAGEIHVDRGSHTEAMHCYGLACAAAREARSGDLWAAALVRQAYIALYDGRTDHVVSLLDNADRVAASGDTQLVTRQWVAAVRAEAHAATGNEQECFRDLTSAEAVTGKSGRGTRSGWLRFDGSRLPELRGSCLVTLGRYDDAEDLLLASLATSTTPRRRSGILCDLVLVGSRLRDTDRVISHLEEVLVHARSTGSGVIRRKLSAVRPELEPMMLDAKIRDIDEKIRSMRHDDDVARER